jgi:hypothetical protein
MREAARDSGVVVGVGVAWLRDDDGARDANDECRDRHEDQWSDGRESTGADRAAAGCGEQERETAGASRTRVEAAVRRVRTGERGQRARD